MRHERNYRELIAARVQRRLEANIKRAKAREEAARLFAVQTTASDCFERGCNGCEQCTDYSATTGEQP